MCFCLKLRPFIYVLLCCDLSFLLSPALPLFFYLSPFPLPLLPYISIINRKKMTFCGYKNYDITYKNLNDISKSSIKDIDTFHLSLCGQT